MKIIISNSSMQPIYEQIVCSIKEQILRGGLKEEEFLPSVRALSRELKISALTVKKAYDCLEEDGFIVTVHGKGSFVAPVNRNLVVEEMRKQVEEEFSATVKKGRGFGMADEELKEIFQIVMEDEG